jgi:hypothetical protein
MTNQATTPATILAATTPPTTPPAIAPVFDLLLEDDGELVEDVPEAGVPVGVLALVEAEAKEAVPVTSGESVTVLRMHGRCNSWTELRTAQKLRCSHIPVVSRL